MSGTSSSSHPSGENELPPRLPDATHIITGHDQTTGKAIIQREHSGVWKDYGNRMNFNVVYTTSEFPANLNDDCDLQAHDEVLASNRLGLVNPRGTVCRVVDVAPGNVSVMHRTQSLDYGIVLEGSVELALDSGDTRELHRGDIVVQRATMHSWRNTSSTDWARMVFILQDCQEIQVGGRVLKEDLGLAKGRIPPSGNDG
jgi:quercetin dioxygenase-like cupin family protein